MNKKTLTMGAIGAFIALVIAGYINAYRRDTKQSPKNIIDQGKVTAIIPSGITYLQGGEIPASVVELDGVRRYHIPPKEADEIQVGMVVQIYLWPNGTFHLK